MDKIIPSDELLEIVPTKLLVEPAQVALNVGVLALVVVLSWCLGAFSQQPVAGVQGLPRQVFCLQ